LYKFLYLYIIEAQNPQLHCVAVCHISRAMLPKALCVAQALTVTLYLWPLQHPLYLTEVPFPPACNIEALVATDILFCIVLDHYEGTSRH